MDSSILLSKEHLNPPTNTTTATSAISAPITPEVSHAALPSSKPHTSGSMTPPPSTQARPSNRAKSPTPNTATSHMSTPPPTIEGRHQRSTRNTNSNPTMLDDQELMAANKLALREKLFEIQIAFQEAKMSAAHYKLQYQMLSQESEAAIERLGVEARMQQTENEIIHRADRNRAAATPVQSDDLGLIQVHRDLYQRMCAEIQNLGEANRGLEVQCQQQHRIIERQETELASLNDRVALMRERIRESRDALRRARSQVVVEPERRPIYHTYQPHGSRTQPTQQNPFAALVQASEMASQESARSGTAPSKSHKRNVHSMSSLPATPQRILPPTHTTPQGRAPSMKMPATAPVSRRSEAALGSSYGQPSYHNNARPTSVYRQPLPVQGEARGGVNASVAQSDGTVSASENDSEAETEIIEHDEDTVNESFASRAAAEMLSRPGQTQHYEREEEARVNAYQQEQGRMRQTTLFGAVRKNVDGRDQRSMKRGMEEEPESPVSKRSRAATSPIGLGIKGVRQ